MASAITHAVSGAAISMLAPRPYRSGTLAAVLALAAVAPDLDVIGLRLGVPYAHPLGHRGFSHSLLGALLVALPIAVAFSRRARRWGRSEIGLLAVVFLACASHGLLDALTDAGLGVGFFIPFDDGRYFFPWRPVRASPLSVGAFFSRTGVEILANEIVWIWIPTALITAVVVGARRARRLPGGARA
jgi:inner membrane protein